MSDMRISIALKVNGREVYDEEAKEALKAYWHSIQKTTHRKMERLYSRFLQWAEDYDRRHPEPIAANCKCAAVAEKPGECTIICNDANGCEKRSCPARTVTPRTWYRRWQAL